ncbi:uncharacterized protein LOC117104626 [Anneissia japonica]|uniref:uncharacterized protein LOC117104626 n=1 Tax=Anneissia japonica TaxID=1529436 RepID=UPI0014259C0D|nr:uncharacterized protein LOC117104626 [Anneissia japonica]XP_033101383.1 uncharacterized protein LOC117104626 [Anneissia japonica]XP_033101384.1 uncharacterized protein LOC117104626 [Anneissia japonica]XP_033101385.1 uncharacterized protein LOC117104626 [Anneissia japonica]XP_033101386.1 uncharacterized protein LOC117104626 [Anneissia japonica]
MFGLNYILLEVYFLLTNLFVVVEPQATSILRQPQNVTEKEGESADFTVMLNDAKPGSTLTWYKDTIYVNKSDPRITYDEANRDTGQFTLRINPLIRSDKGYYVAAYAFGNVSVSSHKAYLDLIEVPSEEYPICTISKPFYDIMENVIVSCITENTSPQPVLQFVGKESKSDVINNGSHIMIQMIFRAHPNLNGQKYSCYQSNSKIETKYCLEVTLKVSNVFNVAISGKQNFTVGDAAKLTCVGNYTKSASFHWYIPDKIKSQVKMELNKNWIEIHVTEESNGKNITCTIEDGGLEGSASVILKVEAPEQSEQSEEESTSTIKPITWLLSFILLVLLSIYGNSLIVTLLLYRIYTFIKNKNCVAKPQDSCTACSRTYTSVSQTETGMTELN